jgi:hypothetical protein
MLVSCIFANDSAFAFPLWLISNAYTSKPSKAAKTAFLPSPSAGKSNLVDVGSHSNLMMSNCSFTNSLGSDP